MKPSVYLYNETDKGYELYLGEYSTLDGLLVFEKSSELSITSFGATLYKKYGWATEHELPNFKNVGSVIQFLESEGDLGIVEFEALLPEFGTFSTHDDGERHYVMQSKQQCINILKAVLPPPHSEKIINQLICNPNRHITCNNIGVIKMFSSFNEHLEKNA